MDIRTERLLTAFRESGLTQTELCNKTGINKGAMSSYLSGRYFPKQQAVEKLSSALHVSVFYLMGLEDPDVANGPLITDSLSSDEERLIELYRSLNAVGKRKAIESLEDLTQIERYTRAAESVSNAV